MTGSLRLLLVLFALALTAARPAMADPTILLPDRLQGGAPSMLGVDSIVLQQTDITDADKAKACGLTAAMVNSAVLDALQFTDVPIVDESQTKPVQVGEARIYLRPLIATTPDTALSCHSFVMLFASARHSARIPPVNEIRRFTIDYWHGGLLVSSPQSLHAETVKRAAVKLAKTFGKAFTDDQPKTAARDQREKELETNKQDSLINSLRQKDQAPEDQKVKLLDDVNARARKELQRDEEEIYEPFAMEPSRTPPAGDLKKLKP